MCDGVSSVARAPPGTGPLRFFERPPGFRGKREEVCRYLRASARPPVHPRAEKFAAGGILKRVYSGRRLCAARELPFVFDGLFLPAARGRPVFDAGRFSAPPSEGSLSFRPRSGSLQARWFLIGDSRTALGSFTFRRTADSLLVHLRVFAGFRSFLTIRGFVLVLNCNFLSGYCGGYGCFRDFCFFKCLVVVFWTFWETELRWSDGINGLFNGYSINRSL